MLFKRSDSDDDQQSLVKILTRKSTRTSRKRVRCPLCGWEPDGKPYWQCERCLTIFDTFATRARCPACSNSWDKTQCIRCGEMSPHEQWYVGHEDDAGGY